LFEFQINLRANKLKSPLICEFFIHKTLKEWLDWLDSADLLDFVDSADLLELVIYELCELDLSFEFFAAI